MFKKGGRKTAKRSKLPSNYNDKLPEPKTPRMADMRSFPLSPSMLVFSFLIWTCIGFGCFKLLQYYGVHRLLNDEDLDGVCRTKFKDSVQENIDFVTGYSKGEAGPYLNRIGSQKFMNEFQGEEALKELDNIPPLVTAVSSSDFWMVQGLIEQVHLGKKKKLDIKLIIYDLGLFQSERQLLVKYCECEVRQFEYSVYPAHIADLNSRAFRPIIMQVVLEEFQSVVWLDPNARLQSVTDLKMLKYRGVRDFFLWEFPIFTSLISYTDPDMFVYFKEKRCTFLEMGMIDAKTMVLYRTNTTWHGIMKPWLKCALNQGCISPPNARNSECFHYKRPKTTGCHWYDQSALSIIVNRVFQLSIHPDKYTVPRFSMTDETMITYYFPEQPWSYNEIALMTFSPLIVLGAIIYMYLRRKSASSNVSYKAR